MTELHLNARLQLRELEEAPAVERHGFNLRPRYAAGDAVIDDVERGGSTRHFDLQIRPTDVQREIGREMVADADGHQPVRVAEPAARDSQLVGPGIEAREQVAPLIVSRNRPQRACIRPACDDARIAQR